METQIPNDTDISMLCVILLTPVALKFIPFWDMVPRSLEEE
jgi:hypothetical protein